MWITILDYNSVEVRIFEVEDSYTGELEEYLTEEHGYKESECYYMSSEGMPSVKIS